jgi:hypothetical protein
MRRAFLVRLVQHEISGKFCFFKGIGFDLNSLILKTVVFMIEGDHRGSIKAEKETDGFSLD